MLKIAGKSAILEIFFAATRFEAINIAKTGDKEKVPAAIDEKFINKVEKIWCACPNIFWVSLIVQVMPKIAPQIDVGCIPNHWSKLHVNCDTNAKAFVLDIAKAGACKMAKNNAGIVFPVVAVLKPVKTIKIPNVIEPGINDEKLWATAGGTDSGSFIVIFFCIILL